MKVSVDITGNTLDEDTIATAAANASETLATIWSATSSPHPSTAARSQACMSGGPSPQRRYAPDSLLLTRPYRWSRRVPATFRGPLMTHRCYLGLTRTDPILGMGLA